MTADEAPIVRMSVEADSPRLVELDRLTHSSRVSPGPGPALDAEWFDREDRDVLVAEVAGRVVGYLSLGPATPLASNAHVLMVHGLAVDPGAARRGVGRLLLRAAVDEARGRGARRLRLRVLGHNDAARRLYESEGFEVEGVLQAEFVLDGQDVDDVLMVRSLD